MKIFEEISLSMPTFNNDHINAVQGQTHSSSVPISGQTERSAGAHRASARSERTTGGNAGGGSAAGGWTTKKSKQKPKKAKVVRNCIMEVHEKDTKALPVTLKKLKIQGWAAWKEARPVVGKSGYVTIKVSFKDGITQPVLEKYKSAVADTVRGWNTTKYKIPNKPCNRVALSRTMKTFGGGVKYAWAGFEDKKKTVSYVMFHYEDGCAVSDEEGAELIALFEAEFVKVERDERHWTACERAGWTITVQDPKKFSGIENKLKKEIQKNKASEGLESVPEKLRAAMVVDGKRFVTDVNGHKHSQMRLTFEEGSCADKLSDQEHNDYLAFLTRHWAKRCATWERVYREKDAQKEAEGEAKEVLTRWVRFLKNKWMLGVLSAAGDIVRSTSSLEEAHEVFLTGVEEQVVKDTAEDRAKAARKARIQKMLKPKVERKVEKETDAIPEKVEQNPVDEVYGGGAAGKKSKKQKQKKQNPNKTTVSMASLVEEYRIDNSDGNAYTKGSFVEVYGPEHGIEKWDMAAIKTYDLTPIEVEDEVKETMFVEQEAEAVETPPAVKDDTSLKSNPFAVLATPRSLNA